MKTLTQFLKELNACDDAVTFSEGKSIEQAVKECHRGDWMLWLADCLEIDDRKMTLAKAHCANTVRHLIRDQRSIKAVDIAIAYGEGIATKEELRAANAAAIASSYAAAAAYAAVKKNRQQTADICRKYIGQHIIDEVNKILS